MRIYRSTCLQSVYVSSVLMTWIIGPHMGLMLLPSVQHSGTDACRTFRARPTVSSLTTGLPKLRPVGAPPCQMRNRMRCGSTRDGFIGVNKRFIVAVTTHQKRETKLCYAVKSDCHCHNTNQFKPIRLRDAS